MYNILGSIALAHLAGNGTVTNTSVVGCGLFRAIRRMVNGEYREAGVETLAALAAPALMSYASMASLVLEVVDDAYSLASPAIKEGDISRFRTRHSVTRFQVGGTVGVPRSP
jgi:hypothetical protein